VKKAVAPVKKVSAAKKAGAIAKPPAKKTAKAAVPAKKAAVIKKASVVVKSIDAEASTTKRARRVTQPEAEAAEVPATTMTPVEAPLEEPSMSAKAPTVASGWQRPRKQPSLSKMLRENPPVLRSRH
jgi:hypothetical protein